jgi:hypothetical protein
MHLLPLASSKPRICAGTVYVGATFVTTTFAHRSLVLLGSLTTAATIHHLITSGANRSTHLILTRLPNDSRQPSLVS